MRHTPKRWPISAWTSCATHTNYDRRTSPSSERSRGSELHILSTACRGHVILLIRFWSRAIQHATPICRARLERAWDRFTASVVEQARDREQQRLRTVEEHMALRRLTIGAEPCYAAAELGLNLPQEVFDDPLLQALQADITDIIIYDNVRPIFQT